MRVLVTNDDGIGAEGIQALRRALRELDDVEVHLVAPDSNRSATARSITTRSPLWVKEIEFGDGDTGFATEGTPVDCVRFADLGLLGEKPELIVSGINHGANLGDDITYSGTVAAAFEGIILGIPAIAISLQSGPGNMGFQPGSGFDFSFAAALAARLVKKIRSEPLPEGTLLNVNVPAGEPEGVEVTKLGKRLYDDELTLVEEDSDGRRRYKIYGFEPSYEDEPGTDLVAVAHNKVALTPIHFDLTHHDGLDGLSEWDTADLLDAAAKAIPKA
jgi:5'-nucleotidase